MNAQPTIAGMSLSQAIGLGTFIVGVVTIWIHLEIRIAEINVELINLKQDQVMYKTDNRRDMELMRSENSSNTKEILRKVDEIQGYLMDHK